MILTRAPRIVLAFAVIAMLFAGCQRGEKSCRYYSLVIEKSDSADEKERAIREIRGLSTEDQQKCNDDKVFKRFATAIEKEAGIREALVESLESIGKNDKQPPKGPSLRVRSEKLIAKALGYDSVAALAARIIRVWRYDAHERNKTYDPSDDVKKALAAAVRRVKDGESKGQILQALWLALPEMEDKRKYEDLLIDLAGADPASQTVKVNIDALKYLQQMRSKKDAAFDAYIHGLFLHDAAHAETYGQARLALSVIPPNKVATRILAIFEDKSPTFTAWAKDTQLFNWEWKEGPKVAQVLSDLHDPRTAAAIVKRAGKAVDASEAGTPKTFKLVKKGFPWFGYITSRLQLTMWALAAMGDGLKDVAPQIGEVASTKGLTVEQRTMPFIGLALSGSSNMWPVMIESYNKIDPNERADFITPMVYAVEPENLADWDKFITADTTEGTQKAIADPTIVARLNVVRECAKQWAAADEKSKLAALGGCYAGFLKTGDNMAKEKAAIGLVHLGAKGADVIKPLLDAFEKSSPADTTLRQVIFVGLKGASWPAKIRNTKNIYQAQQRQVQVPNNTTWIWEFDILLNHIASKAEELGAAGGAKPTGAANPAGAKPAADKPAAPAKPGAAG